MIAPGRRVAWLGVATWVVALSLVGPLPAGAQISKDPAVIARQLRAGQQAEQRALDLLASASGTPEELEQARRLIMQGYSQVRLAMHGVDERINSRLPSPLLPLQKTAIDTAMHHIRAAANEIEGAQRFGVTGQIHTASEALRAALQHIQRALIFSEAG